MRNNIFCILSLIIFNIFVFTKVNSADQFNFNITEVEIQDNGNIYKGLKRGTVTTNDGITINADKFNYNKSLNILNANGNVQIEDSVNKYKIYSDEITYLRNKNIIFTKGNSKAFNLKDSSTIEAEEFEYIKLKNILNASNNVVIEDNIKDYKIFANNITYFRNEERVSTKGETKAYFQSRYEFKSQDVIFLKNQMELSSNKKTTIIEKKSQLYNLNKFKYLINEEILRGEKILVITNYNLPKSDKFYFENAVFNFKKKSFIAKDTKVEIHKGIFDNSENDPRLKGVSSKGDENITVVNKGLFTSCKKNDKCPPWSIKADKIEHDLNKKQLKYKKAFIQIYDFPVLYLPTFFHPDPTVKRQSGLLKPELNNSSILGTSFTIPYFKVISDVKDYTFTPTWFDNKIWMAQNEYRQLNKNSNFIADFGYVKGYKSKTLKKKKTFRHLFANYDLNLGYKNFTTSKLFLSLEKSSDNDYLKIFNEHITKSTARAASFGVMNSQIKILLNHDDYNLESGFSAFESLDKKTTSDKYQYILPYYKFDKMLSNSLFDGSLFLSSNGSNDLNNTNELKSRIINDISYQSKNYVTNLGFLNDIKIDLKNLNSLGKKTTTYKSSPQLEMVGIFDVSASMPLIKDNDKSTSFITPRVSFKFNPTNMKDYSTATNLLNVDGIFNNNRLGLSDSIESGRSLTLGFEYKKEMDYQKKKNEEDENLDSINKYFEFKLATVLRDKEEKLIPKRSTINRKQSNLFGSISNNILDRIDLNYNFSIDNDFNKFEHNDLNAKFTLNNLVTKFHFIENNGEMGDDNVLETNINYKFDESNFISFKTRRNRKLNLTEYYDLVYEYKNDCLTAGIKYKKTYYQDNDIEPEENLLFTVTLFPLTTYEYEADELVTGELFEDLKN